MIRNSPFVQELAHAKRVTRGWAAYLVFLGCVFVVQGLAANQLPTIWPVETGSPASQLQEAAGNLLSILVIFLWVLLYERRSLFTMGFRRPSRGVVNLLLGVVGGAALVSVPVLFLWATGNYVQTDAPTSGSHGWSALPLVIALAAMFVLQGGNEEILMRGFLLQNQGWKVPGWLAVRSPRSSSPSCTACSTNRSRSP